MKTALYLSIWTMACALLLPSWGQATQAPNAVTEGTDSVLIVDEPSLQMARQNFAAFVRVLAKLPPNQALAIWMLYHSPTHKGQSTHGKAIEAQLLIRNGMMVRGLEQLFRIQNPAAIHPQIIQQIALALPADHPAWQVANLKWTQAWRRTFPNIIPAQYALTPRLSASQELKLLARAIAKATPNSREQYRLRWQLALWSTTMGQSQSAERELRFLLALKRAPVAKDQLLITLARLYYQDKRFKDALSVYNQIDKSSDYWVQTLEEKAWTYAQMGNTDQALAQLKTVLSPILSGNVSAEAYYLASFLNLRVCNYESVFQIHRLFKKRFTHRIASLEQIAEQGKTPLTEKAVLTLQNDPTLAWNNSSDGLALPLFFHRDQLIRSSSLQLQALNHEISQARAIDSYLKTQGLGTGLNDILYELQEQTRRLERDVYGRIAELAKRDLKEAGRFVARMRVLEADSIHRLHLLTDKVNSPDSNTLVSEGSRVLNFPETAEVWLDELDHYRVKTTRCPITKGEKTL